MAFLLQFDLSAGVKAQALMQARRQATQDAKSTAGLFASVRPTAQLLCYMCPANASMLCSAIDQETSGAKSWCKAVHIILWMFRYASLHCLRCVMLSVIAVTVCLVRIPCLLFLAQCCEPTELDACLYVQYFVLTRCHIKGALCCQCTTGTLYCFVSPLCRGCRRASAQLRSD